MTLPALSKSTGTGGLVSVIVVNWDGLRFLEDCLRSLEGQDYPAVEIVLVDNGSTDGSPEFVATRFPSVRLLRLSHNHGFAEANNVGIRASCGEYIVLVNNDTKSDRGMTAAFVRAMRCNPRLGAAQGKIRLMADPCRLDNGVGSYFTSTGFLCHAGHLSRDIGHEKLQPIFAAKGACLCLRREAVETAGLFDPDFFAYFEDSDLCWRIALAGYEVAFIPDAEISHRIGGTTEQVRFAVINRHIFKNRIRTIITNLGIRRLAGVLPIHVGICLVLIVAYTIGRRPVIARGIVSAFLWNLLHLPGTLRHRRHVQDQVRKVSDFELLAWRQLPISKQYLVESFRGYWGLVSGFQDSRRGRRPSA